MSKVSIIIPVYNVEKYLPKCLDSVINQTYKNLEIICVNDDSQDNSLRILEKYAQSDERIKIVNRQNGGLSAARNSGLDVAIGDYCYFIDSDDWIELNTIEKLVKIISTNAVDTVVHGANNILENPSLAGTSLDAQVWFDSYIKNNGIYDVPMEIKKYICPVAWNKLYKMDIINKYHCRFPEGLINEDELFLWTYMVHCEKYYYLNEKLYNYLRRSGSIMETRDNSPRVLDILKIEEEIYKTVEKYKNIEEYQEYLTQNYVDEIKWLFQRMPKRYRKEAVKRIKLYYENTNHDKAILQLYKNYKYKKLKQFIQGIFSITNIKTDNYVGKQLKLFGLKFKFKNKYKTLLNELNNVKNELINYQNMANSKMEDLILRNINSIAIQNFKKLKNPLLEPDKSHFKQQFLLFKYNLIDALNEWGVNLGDYVQTIATQNVINTLYPNICLQYWDRDNLSNYTGKPSFTIMQGWFSHSDEYFPNEKILPIFIGTHITSPKREQFTRFVESNYEYFEHIVMGCRDTSTLKFIQDLGLKCYLSRCLTLTLPKREKKQTQNKVYIVDIPQDMLKYIPMSIRQNAKYINQRSVDQNNETSYYINSEGIYMKKTNNLLEEYRNNASLIITSALHCASPCIAMGIPTILIDFEDKNDRFGSLNNIHKIYNKADLISWNIDFNPQEPDIEELKYLMLRNVDLSIKNAFDEDIDLNELNQIRKEIEEFNIK